VATAGTPTTIAAIKLGQTYETYDKYKVNGTKLSINDLEYYRGYLSGLSKEDADILAGKGRSEFMNAGIIIFETIYEILGQEKSIVFDDGLREGVAINATL
jgi:exopolyphosphatase/guanosine-5'-triphosphate,3'-diphosphate pyrophosphatase